VGSCADERLSPGYLRLRRLLRKQLRQEAALEDIVMEWLAASASR